MKRALLILTAFATVTASAQNKEIDAAKKKLEKLEASIAKKPTAANYIEMSNALVALSNGYTSKLIAGFPVDQTIASMGQPQSIEENLRYGNETYNKYVYPDFDLYVDPASSDVQFWVPNKSADPKALNKAYEALLKAKQLDAKEFSAKGFIPTGNLANQFQSNGMAHFGLLQHAKAAENFEKAVEAMALVNQADTLMMYYAGIEYIESENYSKAIPLLKQAIENEYKANGYVYYYMSYAQEMDGDKQAAIATLEEAQAKFPENDAVLAQLANLYMQTDKDSQATIALLQKAQAIDPTNASFYLTESSLWDKIGEEDKAEEALMKAYEINPNSFNTLFNIGIIRSRKGNALVEKANKLDINDVENYNALVEKSYPYFEGSIEMLEKAHQLDGMHLPTAQILRELYYSKRNMEDTPEIEAKYKYYEELVNELTKVQ